MKPRVPGYTELKACGIRASSPIGVLLSYRQRVRRIRAKVEFLSRSTRISVPPSRSTTAPHVDSSWADLGV